jgi:arylsulfatase A-like enzyme
MGEKDYLYKNSPWEESTRVPLVIRAPALSKAGSTVDHPVSLIDLYPTLVELCDLKVSKNHDGTEIVPEGFSVRSFIEDPVNGKWEGPDGALTVCGVGINKPIEGLAVSTNPYAKWHVKVLEELDDSWVMKQNYTYRTKDWRYIRYRNGKGELYDHRNDPFEWNNLALNPEFDEKKKELREKLLGMIHGND